MRRSSICVLAALGCSSPPAPVAPHPVTPPAPAVATPAVVVPTAPPLRLPRTFLPTGYAARLAIDPTKDSFEGSIAISGVLAQASSVISLHGQRLAIHHATATHDREEVTLSVTPRGDDVLELRAPQPLAAGEWTVMIEYDAKLDDVNTAGAFKQTVAGSSYVYTQLEATYARRVFPCFDEPDNKVPWKLTLDIPAKLVAVSNTPIASETALPGDRKRVEFAQTKPLPSYLIAFGVGPFDVVDAGKTKSGTPVRIIALAHRGAEAAYAAKTTPRILELTEEYFGTPYPFEKLDMLAIPITVGFGAEENAGLITFTETLVLLDKPSRQREHAWVITASHEIAHQWFGDLVTMGYWDDIWLKEGFSTWLERKTAARFDPTGKDELAALDVRARALANDSLITARQVRQRILTAEDINNVYDSITYDKGASVLQMFETYLGPDVFQRGVRAYLQARAGGNAASADFIGALSTAAGKDLSAAFATVLEQPGAPEITMSVACTGTPSVTLSQHRYVPPGAAAPAATRPWILPVCLAFDRGGKRAQTCTMLDQPTATIPLESKVCPRWVMPNANGSGYYRNLYTSAQVSALRDEAWPLLSWQERRAVYSDVEDAALTGRLPLMLALSFVPRLLVGNDRFIVDAALGIPTALDALVPDDLRTKYMWWLRETFGPGARRAGFVEAPGDDLDMEVTRNSLLAAVAWSGRDPELVATAVGLAAGWRDLPQAVRGLVLAIAIDAKPELFERIRKDVLTEPDRTRRQEMIAALASVRDVKQQSRAHDLVLDGRLDIRESLALLSDGSADALRANAQQFFRAHQDELMRRLPRDETAGSVASLSALFTSTCRAERRAEVSAYVTATFAKLPGGAQQVKENLEHMDQCIARRAILEPEIRGWLTGVKIPKPAPPPDVKPTKKPAKKSKDRKTIDGAEKAPPAKHRKR